MNDLVHFHVEQPPDHDRNRWTALFRPILIIPHLLLVGGPFVGLGAGMYRTGALGFLALTSAILDWFAILFTGHPIGGLQPFKRLYLGWRARVLAYGCLLRDEYPPFGDGPYPATLDLPEQPATRDAWPVALRLFMLVPHLIVVFALMIAAVVVWLASWIWVVAARRLPAPLWRFNRDVMGYALRVEAYALLIHDCFPSFDVFVGAEKPAVA
jgi:hypothetical protein